MNRSASITFNGVPMDCRYDWQPAESSTWDEPGSPENATLESCLVGGVEIINLLHPTQVDAIETRLIENDAERDEFNASEAADLRRTELTH